MRRRALARGLLAGGMAAAGLPARGAGGSRWTMFSAQPAGSAAAEGLARLAARVAAASEGGLVLKLHGPGSLAVNAAGLAAAVAAGLPQLADDPFYVQPIPAGGLVRLPMLVNTPAEHLQASQVLRPALKAAAARIGLVFLGVLRGPPQGLWLRRPTTGLAGLMGLRVRIFFPEQAELLRRHGGIPLTLALAELPAALAAGAVDGMFAPSAMVAALQADAAAPRFACCLDGYQGQPDSALLATPTAWTALGPGLQAVLAAELDAAAAGIAAARDDEAAAARRVLAEAGVGFVEMDPYDRLAAGARLAPYWANWALARGRETSDLLGVLRRALGR